jgi:hypothetical protein
MTRACTIAPPIKRSRRDRLRPAPRLSGKVRGALGSKNEKSNSHNDLVLSAEFPERFASLANRSEEIAQGLEATDSSANFGSDSRGEIFC